LTYQRGEKSGRRKSNPNHDPHTGEFAEGGEGGASDPAQPDPFDTGNHLADAKNAAKVFATEANSEFKALKKEAAKTPIVQEVKRINGVVGEYYDKLPEDPDETDEAREARRQARLDRMSSATSRPMNAEEMAYEERRAAKTAKKEADVTKIVDDEIDKAPAELKGDLKSKWRDNLIADGGTDAGLDHPENYHPEESADAAIEYAVQAIPEKFHGYFEETAKQSLMDSRKVTSGDLREDAIQYAKDARRRERTAR
jgi:hypothetical protein